jgi:phosphoribosylformimino-5-aminoimidazole carboxamide ribotide isomerase
VPGQLTSTFDIYPAIDLRNGRVVRLREGDFARERVYDEDPVRVARDLAEQGASWIHLVDLDGARAGERRQTGIVGSIVAATDGGGPRFQVAGGLRTPEAVDDVLAAGAARVVIGTAALRDPGFARDAIHRHGADRIAIAIDVREGLAIGDGWVPGAAGVPLAEALERLSSVGVATFVVTAIDRDGLLRGPDLALLQECAGATDAAVVASGGIRSIADLEAARRIGCRGAIVGRAIYDGTLDLAAAIAAVGGSAI